MTHHDPSIYSQPENFDPDRFSEQRAEDKKVPYSFIPFGGGSRQCIGMELAKLELKTMTVALARDCNWKVVGEVTRGTFPVRKLDFDLEIEPRS